MMGDIKESKLTQGPRQGDLRAASAPFLANASLGESSSNSQHMFGLQSKVFKCQERIVCQQGMVSMCPRGVCHCLHGDAVFFNMSAHDSCYTLHRTTHCRPTHELKWSSPGLTPAVAVCCWVLFIKVRIALLVLFCHSNHCSRWGVEVDTVRR